MQLPVYNLEASSLVVGAPFTGSIERVDLGPVATALTALPVLSLAFPSPEIYVAATVTAASLAVVGSLVFTLLKGRHDSAPALHG